MGRPRSGSIREKDGKIIVRTSYTDSAGRRHQIKRQVRSRSEGQRVLNEILSGLDRSHPALLDGSVETFFELSHWYETTHAIDPVYVDGHKVAGLRGKRTVIYRLGLLREYFGHRKLRTITYGQIEAYKLHRLEQKNPHGNPIKLATVHRELALLRTIFNLARREGWIPQNPFNDGKPLIVKSYERGRSRVLSLDEESRLLSVCVGEREHLRPIVVCALDTGLRPGEIFSLTWQSVNLSARQITVFAMNTKTLTTRQVPISRRLMAELRILLGDKRSDDERVFGIQRSIAKAWKTACRLAGLTDLRFYDLRHTFDSRLMEAGMNPLIVSRLMGHSAPGRGDAHLKMTYHYTHATEQSRTNAVEILDSINSVRLKRTQKTQTRDTNS